MQKLLLNLGFLGYMLLLAACATSTKVDNPARTTFKNEVEKRIGSPLSYINNKANDKVLCLNTNTGKGKAPREVIDYLVWDIETAQVLYESSVDGGEVKWHDNQHLEVARIPGMVRPGESADQYIKIINVVNKTVTPKPDFERQKEQ